MGTAEQGQAAQGAGLATGVVLRAVTEPDAPWPGLIVRDAHGRSTLHVDAAHLTEWSAWRADPDGHLLAPLDIERTTTGHDVVMPLCLRRVADLLQDRADAAAPLSDGEAVTLAVSIIRGCAEAGELGADSGQWWVTDDGRPVLAVDRGDDVATASESLLVTLADDRPAPLSHAIRTAAVALRHPRTMQREIDAHEDALFACAEPEPLATTVLVPALARTIAVAGSARGSATAPTERAVPTAGVLGALRAAITRHVDAGVAEEVTTVLSRRRQSGEHDRRDEEGASRLRADKDPHSERRSRRRARSSTPREPRARRRRAPALVAVSLGCAVLGAGLLWPSGDEVASADPAYTAPPISGSAQSDDAPADAGTGVSGASESADDATARGTEQAAAPPTTTEHADEQDSAAKTALPDAALPLMAAASGCATAATACGAAVWEDPSRGAPEGALALDPAARTVTLVEEFGGVAVLRLTPSNSGDEAPPDQLVVIVAVDGKWLVRDAYDVADQP